MNPKDFASQLEKLGALEEPVRRRLYLFVAGRSGDVSRDQAARSAGVTRALAAFHLDKLVEAGLLEAGFRRLSGRAGPGAGRPAKVYRRAGVQIDVSVPERRYEWAAQMLVQALAETSAGAANDALRRAAHEHGERLGRELGPGARRASKPGTATRHAAPLRAAVRALETCGYEPRRAAEGQVVLHNCPFDSLRDGCRDVTCGMNLALIEGLLAGLGLSDVRAKLEPQPGTCCVALRSPAPTEPGDPAPGPTEPRDPAPELT